MAIAGYSCQLKQTGTAVAMTGEATTDLGGDVYQITDTTKRIIDPDTAITVYDGATPIADGSVTVDYLFGKFTLASTPAGAVTVDASYLPSYALAEVRSFEINATAELADSTPMASTTTVHARTMTLRDVSGTVTGLDPLTTDLDSGGTTIVPMTDLESGTRRVLEVTFPGGQIFRAFVRFESADVGAAFDGLVEGTLNWVCTGATGTDQTEGNGYGFSS